VRVNQPFTCTTFVVTLPIHGTNGQTISNHRGPLSRVGSSVMQTWNKVRGLTTNANQST
jgi:hypothetical protein